MGTTPKGYPYPEPNDPVGQGDDVIKALAQAVDDKVGASAAGTATISLAAASAGSVAVTFPAGRFSAAPAVTASANNTAAQHYVMNTGTPSPGGVIVVASQKASTQATISFPVSWIARSIG